MSTLLIGFDSAWTAHNSGAITAALHCGNGKYADLGPPQVADFPEAKALITHWQTVLLPTSTVVLLDQPCIVANATGQRPVENIAGSLVGLRRGAMPPANTSKASMFGETAPVWDFLNQFGGPANPLAPVRETKVFETYPVLTLLALRWALPDSRLGGRQAKYNPERRTFSILDWRHVCQQTLSELRRRNLTHTVRWLEESSQLAAPLKKDQDGVDSCLCLLVALELAERKSCLMVGDHHTGYIVVPHCSNMMTELEARCTKTGRNSSDWVQSFSVQISD
jgi:predicted RNase H-like nuclease